MEEAIHDLDSLGREEKHGGELNPSLAEVKGKMGSLRPG